MTGNEKAKLVLPDYVPAPDPAKTDRLVGAQHFPGWKPGVHRGWGVLADYPERKPLLGWYDESNPEVTDWEIKWALEHGIQFFLYCWYRERANMGKPVTVNDLHLGHAIHEGLFKARYRNMFQFAIMWENGNAGNAASLSDLLDNLVPFWVDNYFSHPSYLKVDGKPVFYVYDPGKLWEFLGAGHDVKRDAVRRAMDLLRERVMSCGFPGIWLLCEYRGEDAHLMKKIMESGFDHLFAYCWHTKSQFPGRQECEETQINRMTRWSEIPGVSFVPTATVGWDPMPWSTENPNTPWLNKEKVTRWYFSPSEYRDLCRKVKRISDVQPEQSLGRRMVLLDNWNEWSEGHFISPSAGAGFGYLQAVRDVFSDRQNLPDYRTPEQMGRKLT